MTTCDRRTLKTLRARIKAKTCTPIISNRLFFSKTRQLLEAWAEDIEYPYTVDQHTSLATVAQYLSIIRNPTDAREQFIQFVKEQLLDEARVLAETDMHLQVIVDDLVEQMEQQSLSEIARMLEYPFEPSAQRALQMLASFRLPVYITTSYYNFLEQALAEGEKVSPRTEIGIWQEDMQVVPSLFRPNRDNYEPDENEPLVYHLLGGDDPKYARYIVLAEDDYLKFLVHTPRHKGKPEIDLIPVRIRQAISNSTLLLLGFHLDDWDFKVLLHALLKLGGKELRGTGIAIQLSLGEDKYGNVDQVKRYIENYFDEENFSVYWGSTEKFLEEIWG